VQELYDGTNHDMLPTMRYIKNKARAYKAKSSGDPQTMADLVLALKPKMMPDTKEGMKALDRLDTRVLGLHFDGEYGVCITSTCVAMLELAHADLHSWDVPVDDPVFAWSGDALFGLEKDGYVSDHLFNFSDAFSLFIVHCSLFIVSTHIVGIVTDFGVDACVAVYAQAWHTMVKLQGRGNVGDAVRPSSPHHDILALGLGLRQIGEPILVLQGA
jgi:hypothetical protein